MPPFCIFVRFNIGLGTSITIMKKIITSLVVALLCTTLSAQERLNFFDYVEDVIGNKLSLNEFIAKYKTYFTDEYDENTSSVNLNNLEIFGYAGTSLTMILPDYNVKVLSIFPDYEILDSISRYESAEKCHKEMIKLFGNPINEETHSYDDTIRQEIAKTMNMKGGTTYTWESSADVLLTSSWIKTDEKDVYQITFMTMELPSRPGLTSVPVQRKFFKTLEFGKSINKNQIALAIETSSYYIAEERTSSGRTYNYWQNLYFGGIEWSFVELQTVGNLFSSITFTHTHTKNNQYIFDSLFKALSQKYGEPIVEDNKATWFDNDTGIMLTYKYGESKGGEMRHYVDLMYGDLKLSGEAENIITNEL